MIKEILKVNGSKPLIALDEYRILTYHKGAISIYNLHTKKYSKQAKLPMKKVIFFLSKIRCFERMFRIAPRSAEIVNENECVIAFKGCILNYNISKSTLTHEHTFAKTMNSPLSFCSLNNVAGFDDGIYYGEYLSNSLKEHPVAIYKRDNKTKTWNKVFQFSAGTVHHIHSIVPSKDKVYILTGDDDESSAIWEATDNFRKVIPILSGSQCYRSCTLAVIGDSIFYCTDTPMQQNYVYQCKKKLQRWEIVERYPIPGSCIYGEFNDREILFSTAVEPNTVSKDANKLLALFDNHIGSGIMDTNVYAFKGNFANGFQMIQKEVKDKLPMRIFQFGSIQFPKYMFSKYGIVSLYFEATKNSDNSWLIIERDNDV